MADTDRDKAMRVVGQLIAACQALEIVNVPHQYKRVRDLIDIAQTTANKAMLAMWDEADKPADKA